LRHPLAGIFARGLAMGMADIVPGVSGGTIALITGIYERLLSAIVAADAEALALLLRGRWRALWFRLDGAFLTVLLSGILAAIFSMASAIHWLLSQYPQPLWAFFSGLILISAVLLLRDEVTLTRPDRVVGFTVGVCIAVGAALMPPMPFLAGLPGLFFAGAIAICAMILPGISGSFMLVLMGMYEPVLSAIKAVQVTELLTLAAGCITGLALFARLLDRVLRSYRALAMAFLSGVLMGSLVAVWPWRAKMMIESGADAVIVMRPVLPDAVSEPQLGACVVSFFAGLLLVWGVQRLASKRNV
jgi:putative membrane protein